MLEVFSQASSNDMLTENLYKLWVSCDFLSFFPVNGPSFVAKD